MRLDLKGSVLDLALLSALKAGSSYGYELITELKSRSKGVFDVAQGTVYPALHRLEKAGQVESEWEEKSGRRCRRYRLTPKGRKELRLWTSRWHEFSVGFDRVMLWRARSTQG